jgi:hypothetical protein
VSTAKLAPALTVRVTTVADGDTIRADNNPNHPDIEALASIFRG